ncbi:mannonate dehydratase [Roseobacter sp.]|uniref:mannonate dehydratase n=1 Tax=Roseobacter sp. TaxID=1907202 RepID=UPI00386B882F
MSRPSKRALKACHNAAFRPCAPIYAEKLRSHLVDLLSEVAPFAQNQGVRLCCHPDDPPFGLLGLPRVMSRNCDYAKVLQAVDMRANGATLCTGSLGVNADFNAPEFVAQLGAHIHFVHLRNTTRVENGYAKRPVFLSGPS